jgi:hypothetical protein
LLRKESFNGHTDKSKVWCIARSFYFHHGRGEDRRELIAIIGKQYSNYHVSALISYAPDIEFNTKNPEFEERLVTNNGFH